MRRARLLMAASSLAFTGVTILASGCGTSESDCIKNGLGECKDLFKTRIDAGPDGGTVVPKCEGDPTTDPTLIREDCGLFVRGDAKDDDKIAGVGMLAQPYKTIQAAISDVTDRWIFVCSHNPFSEQVTITKSKVEIYGGFDCATDPAKWTWKQEGRTTLNGPGDQIALTVSANSVKVENFSIQAGDATMADGSSIAVLVNTANPVFNRCELNAGKPMDGTAGVSGGAMQAQAGKNGSNGGNAWSAMTVNGGIQVTNNCGPMLLSIGGQGGNGNELNGGAGQAGLPSGNGKAGLGDDGTAEWSCAGNMGTGGTGLPGKDGMEGAGAAVSALGTLGTSGFLPVPGGDGLVGQPGQGGGGGGGVKGDAVLCGGKPGPGGASGGSGGSGGCGGSGGKGGHGAGSSIALVSLTSPELTLTAVKLKAIDSANGGAGGDLQPGGAPGAAGLGGTNSGVGVLNAGCKGGDGGKGGNGGPGGGGRGGHSIGLAHVGKAPAIDVMSVTVGKAGTGGQGGTMNTKKNQGADGIAATTQEFM